MSGYLMQFDITKLQNENRQKFLSIGIFIKYFFQISLLKEA